MRVTEQRPELPLALLEVAFGEPDTVMGARVGTRKLAPCGDLPVPIPFALSGTYYRQLSEVCAL